MRAEATALAKQHLINREKNLERKSASSLILPQQPRVPQMRKNGEGKYLETK